MKPTWTRKTYKMVADVLSHAAEYEYDLEDIARAFAYEFQGDNPNFSVSRFYEACDLKRD